MPRSGVGVYRIAPSFGRSWKLRRDGLAQAVGSYPNRAEALERGRALAEAANVDLVIHSDTGTIRIRSDAIRWPVHRSRSSR